MKHFLDKVGQRGTDFLLALLCAVILLAGQDLPMAKRAEWFAFDRLTQWTAEARPIDSSLAIVAVDDGSIQELAQPPPQGKGWNYPWPRSAYADLITYLKAAGAREVWIDLFFETPDANSYNDDVLRAAIAATGNVHIGRRKGATSLFTPNFNVTLPLTPQEEAVLHGDIDNQHLLAWPQPFNKLIQKKNGQITPAAPLIIEGENVLKQLPVDDRTDPTAIAKLLANVKPPPLAERFRDKIVYVGVTANAGYDLKAFPVGNFEPSVMIHVVARSNELQGGFFQPIPYWLRVTVLLLICFLVSGLFRTIPSFSRYLAAIVALAGLVGLIAYFLFLHRIWVQPMMYELAIALTFTVITSTNYVREGRKRRVTEELFGKFVSRKIVDRLVARPSELKLGGEKAELTVLFSDLSGFTTLSETMPSDVLLRFLNTYLNEMSELIYEREGTLDKYIGDAIMAFWGAPDASPDHAWQACHAAIACQKRLAELASVWEQEYGARLIARIGINTDEMTVGMVGSSRLHNYSVIGDAVNLASRLEGANKPFGTSIMIAQRTLDLAQGKVEVRPVAQLQVKGKTKPVMVYELLARAGELDDKGRAAQQASTDAFAAFLRRDWKETERLLNLVLEYQPGDGLANVYLKRIHDYERNPPPADWDGVFKLDDK